MKAALVLRPEPGNAATAARLARSGIAVRCCPLFIVRPIAWSPPDPRRYDALLLTSANAIRHAGAGLSDVAGVPVLAVGEATARAASAAGLAIALVGTSDAATLVAEARSTGSQRLLHLSGRDHGTLPAVDQITVYASDLRPVVAEEVAAWRGHVALLHSPRAARRLAALVDEDGRAGMAIAALSPAVAKAAGTGWAAVHIAPTPTDPALIATATQLIDPPPRATDKQP